MYINNKLAASSIKFLVAIISAVLLWGIFDQYGWPAFRLFPVWVLILIIPYFITNAFYSIFRQPKNSGKLFCPMLEGMILSNLLLITGIAIASSYQSFYLPPLHDWIVVVLCGVLLVLVLLDWSLFVKKGAWRAFTPFYWIALPICYSAMIIFTADFLPSNASLRLPMAMFDYLNFGLWNMLSWFLLVAVIFLIVGYILYLIDFTISGRLARKIVLPHIVVVEEVEE